MTTKTICPYCWGAGPCLFCFDHTPKTCSRCNGSGLVANTDEGEAWTQWEGLPPGADIAVRMGLVRPVPCPECA